MLVSPSSTKYLPGLKNLTYSERLRTLHADSLELRRLKSDLVLTYKLLHNLCNVDYKTFFSVRADSRTRGHPLKLVIQPMSRDCRKYFFSNRVTTIWNALPADTVLASSVASFKTKLNVVDFSKHVRWA